MESLDFPEIVRLVNHTRTTSIQPEPVAKERDSYSVYDGEDRVRTLRIPFVAVYLSSSATRRDIEALFIDKTAYRSQVHRDVPINIIYAESLKRRIPRLQELLDATGYPYFTLKEYLISFIKDETDRYRAALKSIQPSYFVEPKIQVPAGVGRIRPSPLLSFMTDTDQRLSGTIAVLLAAPGQGKTHNSMNLAADLASRPDTIPIYVDSRQWLSLSNDHLSSISRTIVNSFRYFDASIPWIDGNEEAFLRTALKADIFRIIFDGFDEYILWNRGAVNASDTIAQLSQLAADTGSRILVTSRDSFWSQDVSTANDGGEKPLLEYRIAPFQAEHAQNYFEARLGNAPEKTQALSIFNALRREEADLVGRGFVLNLIASAAQAGSTESMISRTGEVSALEWLIEAFCAREKERQKLSLSPQQQAAGFREFAMQTASGAPSTSATLEFAMLLANPDVDQQQVVDSVRRMQSHPLVNVDMKTGNWSFRYDQVRMALLGGRFIDCVSRNSSTEVLSLLRDIRLDGSLGADLSDMIAELAFGRARNDNSFSERSVAILVGGTRATDRLDVLPGRGIPVAVALSLVDRSSGSGASHADRRDRLVRLLGGAVVGLSFVGSLRSLARLDLRGVEFIKNRFEEQEWANCEFDETTRFVECAFNGGTVQYCRGLGRASFVRCTFDDAARGWLSQSQIEAGRKLYCRSDLIADICSVLKKFISRGGLSLRSIEQSNFSRGPISASKYRDQILDKMLNTVLERHVVSGGVGINVRTTSADDVKFFASNNVLTGSLELLAQALIKKLSIPSESEVTE